jgi:hypothetical protein
MGMNFDPKIFELNQVRIRIELAKLNKPQSWLAEQLGESRQKWHYYYKNRKLDYLPQISTVLKIPEQDLVSPITYQ